MADEFDPLFGDALPMGTRVGPAVLGGAIGQGAEGLVYLAEHDRLGRVVVKEFWPKQIASRSNSGVVRVSQPGWQEAYRKACKAFAEKGERLCELPQHPGIVRFHEVIEANGTFYLVMDQVQGIPLATLLGAGKALEPGQVRDLADALTAAAAHLHANDLIHRDIAPDNIIVGADMAQATLIDLNAAKDEVQEGSQSLQGLVKAGYSPFEQYIGASNELDARGDVYAIAAVLIHALTGVRPMVPLRRSELGPQDPDPFAALPTGRYDPGFIAALSHGFALRAADRPASVAAWRGELGLDRADQPSAAPARPPGTSPHSRRLPVFAGLAVAALLSGWFVCLQIGGQSVSPDDISSGSPSDGASQATLADTNDASAAALPSGAGSATAVASAMTGRAIDSTQRTGPEESSSPTATNSPSCRVELVNVQATELVPEQVSVSQPRTKEVTVPVRVEQVYYDNWAPRGNFDRARACDAHSLQRPDLQAAFAAKCVGGRVGVQAGYCKGNHGASDSYIGYILGSCIMTVPDMPVIVKTTRMVERPVIRQERRTVCN